MGIDNNDFQDIIDRYLLNEMNDIEKNAFIEEVKLDPDKYKSIQLEKLISDEVIDRASFMKMLNESEKINQKDVFSRRFYWVIGIAASLVVCIYLFIQPTKLTNEDYFAYANNNIIDPRIGFGGFDSVQYRGLQNDENIKIARALKLFRAREFDLSKVAFEEVLPNVSTNQELTFFMSLSELFSDDVQKAILKLEYLNQIKNYKYHEDVSFYLALAYIKNDQLYAAGKVLWKIKRDEGKYAYQADDILKKIWWFY